MRPALNVLSRRSEPIGKVAISEQLLKFSFFHGPAFSAGLYLSIDQQKGWTAGADAPWEYHFVETSIFRSATIV
jgi:hypothetical protein